MGRGYNTMQKWLQCYAARTMSSPMAQEAPSQRCSLRYSTMLSKDQAQLPKLLDMTPKQHSNDAPKIIFGELCVGYSFGLNKKLDCCGFWPTTVRKQEMVLLWVLAHSLMAIAHHLGLVGVGFDPVMPSLMLRGQSLMLALITRTWLTQSSLALGWLSASDWWMLEPTAMFMWLGYRENIGHVRIMQKQHSLTISWGTS